MTVMFDRHFGFPHFVIRSGVWAEMKPSEQSLYVCLLHESERCSTREIQRTDSSVCLLTGLSSRTLCNARKKLQERGLLVCRRAHGNIYIYTICNPETGKPWPGHPKQRILYRRKEPASNPTTERETTQGEVLTTLPSASSRNQKRQPHATTSTHESKRPLKSYGMPLKF